MRRFYGISYRFLVGVDFGGLESWDDGYAIERADTSYLAFEMFMQNNKGVVVTDVKLIEVLED